VTLKNTNSKEDVWNRYSLQCAIHPVRCFSLRWLIHVRRIGEAELGTWWLFPKRFEGQS